MALYSRMGYQDQVDRSAKRFCHVARLAVSDVLSDLRPVLAQEARKRTVGEQLPASLACGTIVRFVRRVADALNFRAAALAGLFVPTVHSHAFAKCGYLFRKVVTGLIAQSLNPMNETIARRFVETGEFFTAKVLCEFHRRKFRLPQNLVRIRVADAAEEAGIGERSLESVVSD